MEDKPKFTQKNDPLLTEIEVEEVDGDLLKGSQKEMMTKISIDVT